MIEVADWEGGGGTRWLMWGTRYPEGWEQPGKGLRAQVGDGLFGLAWIHKQRIAKCRPAPDNGAVAMPPR